MIAQAIRLRDNHLNQVLIERFWETSRVKVGFENSSRTSGDYYKIFICAVKKNTIKNIVNFDRL